jgi:hypothetical protein
MDRRIQSHQILKSERAKSPVMDKELIDLAKVNLAR